MFIKFSRESLKEEGKKNLVVKVGKTRISIIFQESFPLKKQLCC